MLSMGLMAVSLSFIMFDLSTFLPKLFAKPDEVLHLSLIMTLFLMLSCHIMLCLCSIFRSYFATFLPILGWATALNARFLVKRGQILDLHLKGIYTIYMFMVNSPFRKEKISKKFVSTLMMGNFIDMHDTIPLSDSSPPILS